MSKPELPRLFSQSTIDAVKPAPSDSPAVWAMWRMMGSMMQQMDARLQRLSDIVGTELTFGEPDDGSADLSAPVGKLDNIEGAWVTALVVAPSQLGTGALSPFTFTHGLNVPVLNSLGADIHPLPNVRWPIVMFTHGLKGTNIGPTTPSANPSHSSLHFRTSDIVTADSIQLRIHSDLAPLISLAAPLYVEVFFTRAVR